jgi:biopolymer transport protein TolR
MLQTRACLAERNSEERNIMAFSMAGGGARGPQINVTPLIDVLLTLIIVFMLAVSMDKEYQEKTQIPQPPKDEKGSPPEPERTVIIQVVWTAKDQAPTIKVNRDDVRWEDLELRLAQIYLTRVEKVAFVRGDADVDFQYVADVIDVAHHAGVQRVGLLTQGHELAGE